MSQPVLKLTESEVVEYEGLPRDVILIRYMKVHRNERCPHCGRLIGNHSLKRLSKCANYDGLVVQINKLGDLI
jgi:hypothetical protein